MTARHAVPLAHCVLMSALEEPEPEVDLLQPEPENEPERAPHPRSLPVDSSGEGAAVELLARCFEVLPMKQRKYDIFITHAQSTGQDQCKTLCLLLLQQGYSVWYDMQAKDLTARGMEEGVSQSRHVLIFLSDGYFTRPFCLKELRWAKLYGCNLVGVVEKDSRHSPADFGLEERRAPADLKHVLADVEFLEYQRRDFLEAAMVAELVRLCGGQGGAARSALPSAKPAALEPQPQPEPGPEPAPEPAPELAPAVAPLRRFELQPAANRPRDIAITHVYASRGGDGDPRPQCAQLGLLLRRAGFEVWAGEAEDEQRLEQSVSQSRAVLVFLLDGFFGDELCHKVLRWAKLYACTLLGAHALPHPSAQGTVAAACDLRYLASVASSGLFEKDERHGKADFGLEARRAPADLKHVLADVEFLEYQRRPFLAAAMVAKLGELCGGAGGGGGGGGAPRS
eukprot:SAG11_NODE_2503_length_3278_cov_1.735451_3_plen_454_part_00